MERMKVLSWKDFKSLSTILLYFCAGANSNGKLRNRGNSVAGKLTQNLEFWFQAWHLCNWRLYFPSAIAVLKGAYSKL